MNNLPIIFLALLIGVVIGFEFGKFKITQKLQEFLNMVSDTMLKTAKAEEEKRKERIESLKEITKLMTDIEKAASKSGSEDHEE